MPDITGWSANEVKNLFDILGVKYHFNGYGYVVSTNLQPGAIISLGEIVQVNLENIEPESLATNEEVLEDGKEE